MEVLIRALHRARDPVVDFAHRDGVEDRPCGVPLAPANRRHPGYRPIDATDPSQHLDALRIGLTHTPDDQCDRHAVGQQFPDHWFEHCWLVTDDDPVVHAITPRQFLAKSLLDADVTAGNHDRRPLLARSAGHTALAPRCYLSSPAAAPKAGIPSSCPPFVLATAHAPAPTVGSCPQLGRGRLFAGRPLRLHRHGESW